MPAATPNRSRLRFTLRTLLVVVTGLCIWLGIYTKRARDQKAAVDIIRRSPRSFVQYDDDHWDTKTGFTKQSIYPSWLRSALGEDFFHSPDYVQIEDADLLAQMKYLPDVKRVMVIDRKTSDAHIQNLAGLRRLRSITIQGVMELKSSVNAEGTMQVDASQIMTQVSNDSLAVLGQLPALEEVDLYGKGFNSAGLASLAKAKTLHRVGIYKAEGSFGYWDAEPFRELGTVKKLTLCENLNVQPTVRWDK